MTPIRPRVRPADERPSQHPANDSRTAACRSTSCMVGVGLVHTRCVRRPRLGHDPADCDGRCMCARAVRDILAPDEGRYAVKFRVERDVLAEAVTWVARGLPARPPVPVLAGILIEADDEGTLTLSAFDYEVSAQITVAAEVAEPGTVLVLGRLLADISRNLPDRPIDVATEGSKVQVTCGSSPVQPADDAGRRLPDPADLAPSPAAPSTATSSPRPSPRCPIAADRGDTLPILTGVRVEIEGDKMTLLATDRYRLAMRELHLEPHGHRRQPRRPDPGAHPVRHRHARSAPAARSTSRSAPPPAATAWSASRPVSAARPPACSTASTPRSPRSSPPAPRPSRSSRRAELVEAVKRVALVAERNTPVRLRFTEGQVAIEAGTGDDAQASEAVEATLTGPEIEIAFNPHFLLDGLGAVGTPYSRLSFTQASRPGRAHRPGRGGRRGRHRLPLRPHAGALRELSRSQPEQATTEPRA